MSCSFWLRRHKAAAKKREQERLQTQKAAETVIEKAETVEDKTVEKPKKRGAK
jgi:hypothetical protein